MLLSKKFPLIMQICYQQINTLCFLDIFENRQLKQAMEYVDSAVILSTVHGAKGLEWDYVILGDMERWLFRGIIYAMAARTSLCQLLIAGVPCQVYCHLPLEMSY